MEGSWRSLEYLVKQSNTSDKLKIRVLDITRDELRKDVSGQMETSAVFRKVYEREYGTLGGKPYGLLVGDYEFGRGPADTLTLKGVAKVAAAAHAPFIAAAAPEMFGWSTHLSLADHPNVTNIFNNALYNEWKEFRQTEDARYIGLTMPRILLRLPYSQDTIPVDEFNFNEAVNADTDHDKYVWGNAAYAFAARVTNAFDRHEWCAAVRGVEGGGLVEDLPVHSFISSDGGPKQKCPTEVAVTDRRENTLSELGFIPLCHHMDSGGAVFFGANSVQKPKEYLDPDANANAKLSSQLPYILAVSRFAHFIKVIVRDKVGSFVSGAEIQTHLNNWINYYVLADDSASHEKKAKFPLREARVVVTEDPARPGVYDAIAYLRPHFQLEALKVSMRLVARLPRKR
jgi:type VI secretion system protein ImpC